MCSIAIAVHHQIPRGLLLPEQLKLFPVLPEVPDVVHHAEGETVGFTNWVTAYFELTWQVWEDGSHVNSLCGGEPLVT